MSTTIKTTNTNTQSTMSAQSIQALQEQLRQMELKYKQMEQQNIQLAVANRQLSSKIPKQAKKVYPLSLRYVIEINKGVTETSLSNAKDKIKPEVDEMNNIIISMIKEKGWKLSMRKDKENNVVPMFNPSLFKKKDDKVVREESTK